MIDVGLRRINIVAIKNDWTQSREKITNSRKILTSRLMNIRIYIPTGPDSFYDFLERSPFHLCIIAKFDRSSLAILIAPFVKLILHRGLGIPAHLVFRSISLARLHHSFDRRVHSIRRSHDSCLSRYFHLNCRFQFHDKRNTRSKTVRAEDRAVTESVARSRALHFCPTPSAALAPSLMLSLALVSLRSLRRTFCTSLSRAYGIRKNVPRSFPLSAISSPCRFNPPHPSLSLSHSLSLLHHFIVLVLRTYRSLRFISWNNSVLILVFVSLTHAASIRTYPPSYPHTLVSSLRVRCTREHPTQSATPTLSVYVPLMRERNLG